MELLLHDIPEAVDQALRATAEATQSTVEAVAADALGRALGVSPTSPDPAGPPYHDLDWFFGGGSMDEATLAVLNDVRVVHPEQDHNVDERIAAGVGRTADPAR